MATLDPTSYSPPIAELLADLPLAPLGPGKPQPVLRSKLKAAESAFPSAADRDMVAACCAGLWLAFDFLDEAHAISQELNSVEGSYWHALMHRREPDADNSAYWFRRVGAHPLFEALPAEAQALGLRLNAKPWSPFAFIDLCEKYRDSGKEEEMTLRRLQHREWELLFDWCYRHSLGR